MALPGSPAILAESVLREFPTPYYGFQSVDFVGGHVSYAYGDYTQWLRERGGDPALLTPEYAAASPSGAPSTYKLALPVELHYNRYIADSTIGLMQTPPGSGRLSSPGARFLILTTHRAAAPVQRAL